jgi:putative NADH-flavin reductase
MKLTIFGATGRTGRPLLTQALEAGQEVTAFVRDPAKLGVTHSRLRVIQGDIYDAKAVEDAIEGQDAVFSALGPVRGGPKDVMGAAARNIVVGMKSTGVRRLVTLTGAGVAQPGDEPKLFNRFMSLMLKTFARDVLLDSAEHARIVRASGLDWTIVRVPMLTDGPRTGTYRVGMVGIDDGPRISRADVADFMLKQLEPSAKPQTAPVISY